MFGTKYEFQLFKSQLFGFQLFGFQLLSYILLKSTSLFKNLQQTNYPSLSPDNKHLAFIATESGIDSLWIRAIDSKTNSLLLQAKQNDKLTEPTWSPDSKQLLVSVLNKDSSKIMQFDVELGNALKFKTTNNVKMGKWANGH